MRSRGRTPRPKERSKHEQEQRSPGSLQGRRSRPPGRCRRGAFRPSRRRESLRARAPRPDEERTLLPAPRANASGAGCAACEARAEEEFATAANGKEVRRSEGVSTAEDGGPESLSKDRRDHEASVPEEVKNYPTSGHTSSPVCTKKSPAFVGRPVMRCQYRRYSSICGE